MQKVKNWKTWLKRKNFSRVFDTVCAKAIYDILPIEALLNTWGNEFYFSIILNYPLDETATLEIKAGDIGVPTPASIDKNPVPASEVNIVGRLLEDLSKLKTEKILQKNKYI